MKEIYTDLENQSVRENKISEEGKRVLKEIEQKNAQSKGSELKILARQLYKFLHENSELNESLLKKEYTDYQKVLIRDYYRMLGGDLKKDISAFFNKKIIITSQNGLTSTKINKHDTAPFSTIERVYKTNFE